MMHRDLNPNNIGICLEYVIVDGAGDSGANGRYRRDGTKNNKELWLNEGDTDYRIQWSDNAWSIDNIHVGSLYRCSYKRDPLSLTWHTLSQAFGYHVKYDDLLSEMARRRGSHNFERDVKWVACRGREPNPSVTCKVRAKVLDFSHAKRGIATTICGSDGFTAPELRLRTAHHRDIHSHLPPQFPHIDLYSFGVVLFTMLADGCAHGKLPSVTVRGLSEFGITTSSEKFCHALNRGFGIALNVKVYRAQKFGAA
jgi:serine/threonine protein kinase